MNISDQILCKKDNIAYHIFKNQTYYIIAIVKLTDGTDVIIITTNKNPNSKKIIFYNKNQLYKYFYTPKETRYHKLKILMIKDNTH